MIKTCTKRPGTLRRKDGITRDVTHWLRRHAALCVKPSGLRDCSVNFVDRQRLSNYDVGFSEQWFDLEEALVVALERSEARNPLADLPNFDKDISAVMAAEYQIL